MDNTTLNARVLLAYKDYEYWDTIGKDFVLENGEMGICSYTPEGADQPTILLKVGNGVTPFYQLPWTSGLAADVYSWAKAIGIHMEQEGTGEIVTNIYWDSTINDGIGGIKVQVKSLSTIEEEVATEGITATVVDTTLKLDSAQKTKVIKSINLI